MAKYCSQCGVEVKEEDKFCSECGCELEAFNNEDKDNVVQAKKNVTGVMSLIGFVLSLVSIEPMLYLTSVVLCLIAFKKSDGSKETYKGFAAAGIIINFLKLLLLILLAHLLFSGLDGIRYAG